MQNLEIEINSLFIDPLKEALGSNGINLKRSELVGSFDPCRIVFYSFCLLIVKVYLLFLCYPIFYSSGGVVSEVPFLRSLTISFDMSGHPICPLNQKGEGTGDNKTEK